ERGPEKSQIDQREQRESAVDSRDQTEPSMARVLVVRFGALHSQPLGPRILLLVLLVFLVTYWLLKGIVLASSTFNAGREDIRQPMTQLELCLSQQAQRQ